MKELKLLPEDWKGEIYKGHADFVTFNGTIYYPCNAKFQSMGDAATYYNIIDSKAVELKPEPRPENSIKLSECYGRHLIIVSELECERKITLINGDWWSCNLRGYKQCASSDIKEVLKNYPDDSIKIYDMTRD